MKNLSDDIKERLLDLTNESKDSNLQHLIYVFAGYRATILNDEDPNPYSSGSARALSTDVGIALAKEDLAKMPEKFSIAEFKAYINKKCDSFGDVIHFLNAKNIREANEPEEIEKTDEE